jgi:hypothetical protein
LHGINRSLSVSLITQYNKLVITLILTGSMSAIKEIFQKTAKSKPHTQLRTGETTH